MFEGATIGGAIARQLIASRRSRYRDRTKNSSAEAMNAITANGFPITYAMKDRQYVAIGAGGGGPLDAGLESFTPELLPPAGSPTLFVFALPDRC